MTYRSDVDALAARTESLAAEVASKTRELDSARALLDEARAKARLPVLPNIKVATPCSADWEKMTGTERVRACADCNKNVYNISTLTREEAEALILEKEGRLCVRYYQRHDGTILLKDCAIGIVQKRKRRRLAAGVVALLGSAVAVGYIMRPKKIHCSGAAVSVDPSGESQAFTLTNVMSQEMAPVAPPEQHMWKMGDVSEPEPVKIMGKIMLPRDPIDGERVKK